MLKPPMAMNLIFTVHDGYMGRVLASLGGYVNRWGSVSWGTWREDYPLLTGIASSGQTANNDRLRHAKGQIDCPVGS